MDDISLYVASRSLTLDAMQAFSKTHEHSGLQCDFALLDAATKLNVESCLLERHFDILLDWLASERQILVEEDELVRSTWESCIYCEQSIVELRFVVSNRHTKLLSEYLNKSPSAAEKSFLSICVAYGVPHPSSDLANKLSYAAHQMQQHLLINRDSVLLCVG